MNCLPYFVQTLPWRLIVAPAVGAALLLTGCTTSSADTAAALRAEYPLASYDRVGQLDYGLLPEASGMAVSAIHQDVLWFVNDAGNPAELISLNTRTMVSRITKLANIRNRDWEDLATFAWQDRQWLLIGDIGDNNAVRDEVKLILTPEPKPRDKKIDTAISVSVTYPGGARDAESLAVDQQRGFVYVLSKRDNPPELYRLKISELFAAAASGDTLQFERVGDVTSVPQPTPLELRLFPRYGKYRAQITAMDVSPDGRRIAVLTYGEAYVAIVGDDGDWLRALNEALYPAGMPILPQPETIAIANDGVIWITTEQRDAPLLRLTPAPAGTTTQP